MWRDAACIANGKDDYPSPFKERAVKFTLDQIKEAGLWFTDADLVGYPFTDEPVSSRPVFGSFRRIDEAPVLEKPHESLQITGVEFDEEPSDSDLIAAAILCHRSIVDRQVKAGYHRGDFGDAVPVRKREREDESFVFPRTILLSGRDTDHGGFTDVIEPLSTPDLKVRRGKYSATRKSWEISVEFQSPEEFALVKDVSSTNKHRCYRLFGSGAKEPNMCDLGEDCTINHV